MPLSRKEEIRKAVVDTEPLANALILNCVRTIAPARRGPVVSRSRISEYLKDPTLQTAFLELFDSIQTIVTTSHVIGEVNRFALKGEYREHFWRSGMDWLRNRGFDERLIRLLDVQNQESWSGIISRIGPVDAGLIRLAHAEGCHLLTDDGRTLHPLALRQGVDCRLVEECLCR